MIRLVYIKEKDGDYKTIKFNSVKAMTKWIRHKATNNIEFQVVNAMIG